MLITKMEVQPK